jgi:sulfur-carrier protein
MSKELPIMKNAEFKVLADADLILEFFVNRDKYIEDVETFIGMIRPPSIVSIYITDKCLKRLHLESDNESIAKEAIHYINEIFEDRIIEINQQIREKARQLNIIDLDSAEEYICASIHNIGAIITLNSQNFDGASISILSIKDLIRRIKLAHTVTLNIPTSLQIFTNQQQSIPLSGGNSVREVIEQLEMNCPGIKARLCDDSGQIRRFLNFYVNDEDIRFLDGIDTLICDGDEVSIVPAVAGG